MKKMSGMVVSKPRKWFNRWVETSAKGKVLDVGKSIHWDYGFDTVDSDPGLNPTILGDICNSGIQSSSYDIVLCNGMYEFVEDPQRMVDEVSRILKSGGTAIFGFVGKQYIPYKRNWKYYDGSIKFTGMDVVKKKDFDNYHFIICKKI